MFPVLFLVFWLYFILWWVVVLALAIIYGIQAGRGEWTEYPVLGKWARKILRIGPRGAPLQEETLS